MTLQGHQVVDFGTNWKTRMGLPIGPWSSLAPFQRY